jgi:uncharacterized membrane protein
LSRNQKRFALRRQDVGVIGRHFLRRYALAAHEKPNKRVRFHTALAETAGIFVALPLVGIFNFTMLSLARLHLKWLDQVVGMRPRVLPYVIGVGAMLIGYLVLHKRMQQYLESDPDCYFLFDTKQDAEAATLMRVLLFTGSVIVPLLLGLLVLAW